MGGPRGAGGGGLYNPVLYRQSFLLSSKKRWTEEKRTLSSKTCDRGEKCIYFNIKHEPALNPYLSLSLSQKPSFHAFLSVEFSSFFSSSPLPPPPTLFLSYPSLTSVNTLQYISFRALFHPIASLNQMMLHT